MDKKHRHSISEEKAYLVEQVKSTNNIDPELFDKYNVKRGLRNADATGVVAGLTTISNVHGYNIVDGVKYPDEGSLRFRGYEIYDLLSNPSSDYRYNFEEVAYLLLMGKLPTRSELEDFVDLIESYRELPDGFTSSILMMETPPDIMNVLSRSVFQLYAYDRDAEDRCLAHEVLTACQLIARMPRIMVHAYHNIRSRYHGDSMYWHHAIHGQTTAETILSMMRADRQFTAEEARMLDVMMCLHAEHGGGNNSTFTTRVVSSSDTDPYSAYAAAIGSLKGRKHGGANHRVRGMQQEIKDNVKDWENEDEIAAYLEKILRKEAFDHSGLLYGMGHAVYTLSDPRAVICKRFASKMAEGTEFEAEYKLLSTIERIAPEVFLQVKGAKKNMCANIDMYTGFVYSMMGIPEELITPLFACGRFPGWAAHRIEEITTGGRIIRPAYKTAFQDSLPYTPIDER